MSDLLLIYQHIDCFTFRVLGAIMDVEPPTQVQEYLRLNPCQNQGQAEDVGERLLGSQRLERP